MSFIHFLLAIQSGKNPVNNCVRKPAATFISFILCDFFDECCLLNAAGFVSETVTFEHQFECNFNACRIAPVLGWKSDCRVSKVLMTLVLITLVEKATSKSTRVNGLLRKRTDSISHTVHKDTTITIFKTLKPVWGTFQMNFYHQLSTIRRTFLHWC